MPPLPLASAATPEIHAHRGATIVTGVPRFGEESLAAYRNAARHGFVLEVDAKLAEDGVPVAVHDAALDRTTKCAVHAELARRRARRTPPRLGAPLVTVMFNGNARVLPELEGPERARLAPPVFRP